MDTALMVIPSGEAPKKATLSQKNNAVQHPPKESYDPKKEALQRILPGEEV